MKRRIFLQAAACSLARLYTQTPFASVKEPFKLVYFDDYPPFSYRDSENRMRGIFIDVLTEAIEQKMGIPVVHAGYPWKRAQQYVREGKADAFCTVPSDQRRAYTIISKDPVIVSPYRIITRKDHPKLAQMNAARKYTDLEGLTFGYYIGGGWTKRVIVPLGLNVEWTNRHESVYLMMAKGRNDLTLTSSHVSRAHISNLNLGSQLIELPHVFDSISYNLCIGKHSQYASIMPEFEQIIDDMRKTGRLEQIMGL